VTSSVAIHRDMPAALASTFGHSEFRPLQEEIVRAILDGSDVFVLMPTGGGKSLCYQLPATMRDGTTIVVSPLIALMKDQVDAITALGVPATFINSSLDVAEVSRRSNGLRRGDYRLVYVAPERLMTPGFLHLLKEVKLDFIAVDEAHCISEWGHDFRPEYRQLAQLRSLFPSVSLGAFTATATSRVQADIRTQLGLLSAPGFQGSFNRANLVYEVRPKKDAYRQLVGYLRAHPQSSGIVYCGTRNGTEDLALRLRADGIDALAYHAGLDARQRHRRQEAFSRDDARVMVATVAFGMGIDKPDVRFVVHYDLPRTLENYYQESGRAGRDGETSDCILFYTYGDVVKLQRFADEKPESERQVAIWQLRQMQAWAESTTCRRRALLAYFDEEFDGQETPCCDLCRAPGIERDMTVPAQKFLSCVRRTGERFGAAHVISVLRGSRNERVLRFRHDRLSTYGIGRDLSEDDWRDLARELETGGYTRSVPERFNAVVVTPRGEDVLFRAARVTVTVREPPQTIVEIEQPHPDLLERLRALRKRLADDRGVAPFIVFSDRALRAMAARLPDTESQLLALPGVGRQKAADFGPAFLTEIAGYVSETGAIPVEMIDDSIKVAPSGTVLKTLELFRAGNDVATIVRTRNLAPSTIERHLEQAIEAGEAIDIDPLVPPDRRATIEAAMDRLGDDYLGPLMDALGGDYTYGELRLIRADRRRRAAAG